MKTKISSVLCFVLVVFGFIARAQRSQAGYQKVAYKTIRVDGLDVFYREAGNPDKPALLLLHGFPSSSFMYRDLINDLSANYHLIAPDYPGFGLSSQPPVSAFDYSFDHLAAVMEDFISRINLKHFSLYMQDYGGPIGFRIAAKHPGWISALIIQNANAYQEGLGNGFKKIMAMEDAGDKAGVENILKSIISFEGIKVQYTGGANNPAHIDPDAYLMDYQFIKGEENEPIQNALFQNYHINLTKYPDWQQYLRQHQPPTLVVWGKNDPIFIAPGGLAYQKDLKNAEVHLLNGGHFALVEYHAEIAAYIRSFLREKGIR
ncbi:alpha/beta fold hydrolase [Mucilaginibacter gotjawali]|uniref:Pimeloyl-ACP methyl ester carboxylesterase n=2 Tax=Mucilaginibacter gotjawali TaxID=1550579 RepID=A0A839S9D0_9SPHI|nr:alpha/beta hydrolase [Mucilaginibacter gotjawali]MBB3054238.1 pimeloyl-ACP methyl ester carboxylesterase [Mucilaginibacter gotjawali]BAU51929.1 Haloalkane dehalogenase [Mucilaginibacter gotjawali]